MAFTFAAAVAWDPIGKQAVKNTSFQVYATADTGFVTPLAITDTFGVTLPGNILNSGSQGVFPEFEQDTESTVVITDPAHTYVWTVTAIMQDTSVAAFVGKAGSASEVAVKAAAKSAVSTDLDNPASDIATKLSATYGPTAAGIKTAIAKHAGFGRAQVYNNTGTSLRKFRAAQARAESGGNPVNVLLKADSIGQSTVNAPFSKNSWFARVQAMVEARVGYYGSGMNFLFDVGGQDTRWSQSGTWGRLAGKGMVEAQAYTTVTAGSTVTFTDDFDRITVYYLVTSDAGTTATYALNGGAATTFGTAGAEAVQSFTVTATRGTNSLVITAPTTGRLTLLAVDVRVGTTKGYRFQKAAVAGQVVGNFTRNDAPGAPLALSATVAVPDLTVIALETNDYANWATPLATYRAGLVTLITSAQTTGDVVLIATPTPERRRGSDGIGGNENDIPLTTSPTLADYTATLYELADTYNCVVLDFQERWGDFTAANTAGLMADDYHPSDRGNWDYAHAVYESVFQYGTTAEVLTDNKRIWKAPQTFGDPASGSLSRFMVGSFEQNGSVFPDHPYYLATAGGNVYTAAPGTGKFMMFRSDMMVSAGTKWKGENANLPAGDFDAFIRVKGYTTATRPTAANAGVGGHCFDTTLGKPIWSNGTNWVDATGTVV